MAEDDVDRLTCLGSGRVLDDDFARADRHRDGPEWCHTNAFAFDEYLCAWFRADEQRAHGQHHGVRRDLSWLDLNGELATEVVSCVVQSDGMCAGCDHDLTVVSRYAATAVDPDLDGDSREDRQESSRHVLRDRRGLVGAHANRTARSSPVPAFLPLSFTTAGVVAAAVSVAFGVICTLTGSQL